MAWLPQGEGTGVKKPEWEYKKGVDYVTVLPNSTRTFLLIEGENDPTKSWTAPISAWVHQFRAANGFATLICNKWNEACPFCYENELFKQKNPNYKTMGGRLPYGLSKRALIQVYDFELGKVLWLLAGQNIIEGMDFILNKQAHMYKGIISITRMGDGLNTKYRVDISQAEVTDDVKRIIAEQVVQLSEAEQLMILNHAEVTSKTGINPVSYFTARLKEGLTVDISSWGDIPVGDVVEGSVPASTVANSSFDQINPIVPPKVEATSGNTSVAWDQLDELKKKEIGDLLDTECSVGVYKGKKLVEVIRQTGKAYIQYLHRSGNEMEKDACNKLLNQWDLVDLFMQNVAF